MNFKDTLADDFEFFFDDGEFAEEANIDGKSVTIVPDEDTLKEHKIKNGGEGLAAGELLFYAKKSDFEEELFIGKTTKLNKDLYRISDLQESAGMYTVTLVGYHS
jgi:hypothetical protein